MQHKIAPISNDDYVSAAVCFGFIAFLLAHTYIHTCSYSNRDLTIHTSTQTRTRTFKHTRIQTYVCVYTHMHSRNKRRSTTTTNQNQHRPQLKCFVSGKQQSSRSSSSIKQTCSCIYISSTVPQKVHNNNHKHNNNIAVNVGDVLLQSATNSLFALICFWQQ